MPPETHVTGEVDFFQNDELYDSAAENGTPLPVLATKPMANVAFRFRRFIASCGEFCKDANGGNPVSMGACAEALTSIRKQETDSSNSFLTVVPPRLQKSLYRLTRCLGALLEWKSFAKEYRSRTSRS